MLAINTDCNLVDVACCVSYGVTMLKCYNKSLLHTTGVHSSEIITHIVCNFPKTFIL